MTGGEPDIQSPTSSFSGPHIWWNAGVKVAYQSSATCSLRRQALAAGNETVGRPSRPDFLLARGELLTLAAGLQVVAFEDGFLSDPDRFVQRIAAVRAPLAAGASLDADDVREFGLADGLLSTEGVKRHRSVVADGRERKVWPVRNETKVELEYSLPRSTKRYVRVQALSLDGRRAFSNPIYLK